MSLFTLLALLFYYGIPTLFLGGGLWLLWKLTKSQMPRPLAIALMLTILLVAIVGEIVPKQIAERIARHSASNSADSVVVDSLILGTATTASEAMAAQTSLRFTEGLNEGGEEPALGSLPLGPVRFTATRPNPEVAPCSSEEMEQWLPTPSGVEPIKRCVVWQKVSRFEARFAAFQNLFVSYWIGPYRITEQQEGVVRRTDGRRYNVYKNVEVTGGVWWHLVDLSARLTGLIGFGHPGYMSSTFRYIPQHRNSDSLFRGSGVNAFQEHDI